MTTTTRNGNGYAALSEAALLRRLAKNADKLEAVDAVYAERLALLQAARNRSNPVPYDALAEAAGLSLAGIWKILRLAKRNG